MIKKRKSNSVGAWAFLIGIVLAVTIGAFSLQVAPTTQTIVLWILILLGIILGIMNINTKEASGFLITTTALVIVSYFGRTILGIIPILGSVLGALLVLFVPAVIIVALRSIFEMAKN